MPSDRLYKPRYQHLVWNRTDLTPSSGNLAVSYGAAGPPLLNETFPPNGYKGEIIPPYAAMRVIANPIWYKESICWPVARPDDGSMAEQAAGVHFFNGPAPIPVGGFGLATNDLPAPVLIDITLNEQLPYGNVSSTGSQWNDLLVGFVSGSFALHPAADIIEAQSIFTLNNMLKIGNVVLPGGSVTMLATMLPYVIIGQHPTTLTGKTPGKTDSPTVAFNYSSQLFWVGAGGLGFGAAGVGTSP